MPLRSPRYCPNYPALPGRACRPWRAGLLAALLVLAACGSDHNDNEAVACTAEGYTPIRSQALDAVSGAPVALTSASIAQTAGPSDYRYNDTRLATEPAWETRRDGFLLPLQMGGNRVEVHNVVGTFDLTLRADGYQAYVRQGIEISWSTEGCYKPTNQVEFDALMEPLPGT